MKKTALWRLSSFTKRHPCTGLVFVEANVTSRARCPISLLIPQAYETISITALGGNFPLIWERLNKRSLSKRESSLRLLTERRQCSAFRSSRAGPSFMRHLTYNLSATLFLDGFKNFIVRMSCALCTPFASLYISLVFFANSSLLQ
jgi:hypothetical protein